jgi:hypothetical protein
MRCEQYEPELTVGAAGGPITPELDAHLGSCAACRDRLEGKRALLGRIDQVLTSHLGVEPSALLRRRVKERVGQAQGKDRRWAPWAAAALAAGLGMALLAGGLARLSPDTPAKRVTATGPDAAGGTTKPERVVPVPSVPTPGVAVTPSVDRRRSAPAVARRAVAPEPEVLVPPGQDEALRRFAASLREDAGAARPLLGASATVESPVVPPPLIQIPVLASEPLADPADPLERSKS